MDDGAAVTQKKMDILAECFAMHDANTRVREVCADMDTNGTTKRGMTETERAILAAVVARRDAKLKIDSVCAAWDEMHTQVRYAALTVADREWRAANYDLDQLATQYAQEQENI